MQKVYRTRRIKFKQLLLNKVFIKTADSNSNNLIVLSEFATVRKFRFLYKLFCSFNFYYLCQQKVIMAIPSELKLFLAVLISTVFLIATVWIKETKLLETRHLVAAWPGMEFFLDMEEKSKRKDGHYKIHFVVYADTHFRKNYRLQLETLRCYTRANNYNLIIPTNDELDNDHCSGRKIPSFFLRRHCYLAYLMEQYKEDDYFMLLDADTMTFDLTRKFPKEYLQHDLVFYERCWNGEVHIHMGIKNKPQVREWILMWSLEDDQPYVPPRKYFYSSDNGLLHVALMKWFVLGIKRIASMNDILQMTWPEPKQRISVKCIEKFSQLNQTVENLNPYWSFIMCARVALGMQGRGEKFYPYGQPRDEYILEDFRRNGVSLSSMGISLKILPRYHGIALDRLWKGHAAQNVVLLHGVKNNKDVMKFWQTFDITANQFKNQQDPLTSIYPLCKLK